MTDSTADDVPEAFIYDTENEVYRTTCDLERSVSTTLLMAISTLEATETEELPPLREAVDPDALDAIFTPRENGSLRRDGTVSFTYAGYDVTFHSTGELLLGVR